MSVHEIAVWSRNSDGRAREIALRRLCTLGDGENATILACLLERMNDWVPVIRDYAAAETKKRVTVANAADWVPLLGAIPSLLKRQRADHSWLQKDLQTLLTLPETRASLLAAVDSRDPSIARWAFAVAMQLPEAERSEMIARALRHLDMVVRLRGARAVVAWRDCPGRDRHIERMLGNRSATVRKEGVYAALAWPREQRRTVLERMLLDRSGGIRAAVRVYLRDLLAETGDEFDFAEFYRNRLRQPVTGTGRDISQRFAAIGGLSENGTAADAKLLLPLAQNSERRIATAAVRGVAKLDHASHRDWLMDLLVDPRPGIGREALHGLKKEPGQLPLARLREILHGHADTRGRLRALTLLLLCSVYDAMPDAIFAIASHEPALAAKGSAFLSENVRWSSSMGPSEAHRQAVVEALALCSSAVDPTQRNQIHRVMGV